MYVYVYVCVGVKVSVHTIYAFLDIYYMFECSCSCMCVRTPAVEGYVAMQGSAAKLDVMASGEDSYKCTCVRV